MWRILTILQEVLTLTRDLKEIRQHTSALSERIFALSSDVRSLSERIEANAQRETSERKALALWFENELLKADRGAKLLKSAGKKKRRKLKSK